MQSQALKRERALTAIEKSIRDTHQAHSEYLAVLDARWKERVASKFAENGDEGDEAKPIASSANEQLLEL